MDPYSRLAPFIREYIYEKKWKALRDIQGETIAAVLDGEQHLLIAAGTAAGKTEAALFPVLTLLTARPARSLGVLYISPLKALINDQAERLEGLLARGDLPLWRWHGDVPGTRKQQLPGDPRGILQITPESLEALLIRWPDKLKILFGDLAFVIIDEVHAFMGSDRGAQVLCQISRIEEASGSRPRRIGLSASLGDYGEALRWLASGSPRRAALGAALGAAPGASQSSDRGSDREAVLIRSAEAKKELRIALDYFKMAGTEGEDFYRTLYEQCRNRSPGKCIIFTNSRLEAEETIVRLKKIAGENRDRSVFQVHHGSISALLREEAERKLKEEPGPVVTAATASLELGIDIGDLDRIIQIGPPLSAAAFVQRLGRSGRRTGLREIYFTIPDTSPRGDPIDAVPWALLRTVAVIELYLREKWIEPAPPQPYPFSLLCHQTLSVLASLGEQRPADLARRVLSLPVFSRITEEDYRELLTHLISLGYLQKTDEGTVIIGLEGEPVVNHYSFYPVFPEETTYRVVRDGMDLGTINFLPPRGSSIVLGGRYWRVETAGAVGGEIPVAPAQGGGEGVWHGGGAEIHPRIVRGMRDVLAGERNYPYLTERARTRLAEGRRHSRSIGLIEPSGPTGALRLNGAPSGTGPEGPLRPDNLLRPEGPFRDASFAGEAPRDGPGDQNAFFLVPWLGSRGMRTLLALLRAEPYRDRLGIRGLSRKNDFALRLVSSLPLPAFREELNRLGVEFSRREDPIPGEDSFPKGDSFPGDFPAPQDIPYTHKFDHLLPPRLLAKQYRSSMLGFAL